MDNLDNFTSIGEILGTSFKSGAEYSIASKYAVFFSFWKNIVGARFFKYSKPYSIKGNKLYVACSNSFISQELLMYKKELLDKIQPYAKGVDIKILDIVFSYKNWKSLNEDYGEDIEEEAILINPYKIDDCEIDEGHIASFVDEVKFLNNEQKAKLFKDILSNVKVVKNKLKK